ncbi:choice-of-anchor H family protein [Aliikangiella sp. IMCC44359]|uniref:choice-of-anchor H family protein n=1 Tax=Aliikangiella sp. IMCC44359 TaxID=3459125 RepID=UPI00403B0644
MKKYWLVSALLLNFSAIAATENKLESSVAHSQASSKGAMANQSPTHVNTGITEVKRKTVNKQKRPQLQAKQSQKKLSAKYRSYVASTSARAAGFLIDSVWTSLDYDHDGDGYFSEFTVNFDANFSGGYADVFAELYLSKNGGPWVLYETTDVFTIHANDSDDYYTVSTKLNYGFPTDNYDVLIDLFESGYSGVVDTVGPDEFGSLSAFPLEDNEHELNSDNTLITYVASELSGDLDADGFYTKLTLEYDIDTFNAGRLVYAKVILTNTNTFESNVVTTESFTLGNQTEIIDLILQGGYIAGWYDVEIQLVDNRTGQVLANAAQDFSSLSQLAIESEDYDYHYDSTVEVDPIHHDHDSDSHGHGGGSFAWLLIGLVGALGFRQQLKQ